MNQTQERPIEDPHREIFIENHVNLDFSSCQDWDLIADILNKLTLWDIDQLSYNLYRKDLRRLRCKKLKYEEEMQLIKLVTKGDEEAKMKLYLRTLPYVIFTVHKYANYRVSRTDLISEGNIGMLNAFQNLSDRGYRFSTYARFHIRGAVIDFCKNHSNTIRHPYANFTQAKRIRDYINRYYLKNGRNPSKEEISESLDIALMKVVDFMRFEKPQVSLDAFREGFDNQEDYLMALDDWSDGCMRDKLDDDYYHESLQKEIRKLLDILSPIERDIIISHFGLGCTEVDYETLGMRYKMSRERVRQIKDKAIRRLKGKKTDHLRHYLGETSPTDYRLYFDREGYPKD